MPRSAASEEWPPAEAGGRIGGAEMAFLFPIRHWMLLYAMGMVSQPLMGIISDRFSRKTVLLPAFTIMGLLYLVLPMAEHNIQLALVIAAMGLFFYGTSDIATAAGLDIAATHV